MIKITRLQKMENAEPLRAFVNIEVDGVCIYGCKVINGKTGLFAQFPAIKNKNGQYYPVVDFDSKNKNTEVKNAILDAYRGNND